MTNPFATWTLEDLAEDPTRPGSYVLKATPAIRVREPVRDVPQPGDRPVVWPHAIPATLPASTTEEQLRGWIRKVALPHGWAHFHVHDSRRSAGEGFPDDLLTNGTDILMWELKMKGNKPTKDQMKWLSLLAHTGKVECGVFTPQDWPEMVERLTRKETTP